MGFDMNDKVATLVARHGGKVLIASMLALFLTFAAAGEVAAMLGGPGQEHVVPACKVANNNSSVWTHNPHCAAGHPGAGR